MARVDIWAASRVCYYVMSTQSYQSPQRTPVTQEKGYCLQAKISNAQNLRNHSCQNRKHAQGRKYTTIEVYS